MNLTIALLKPIKLGGMTTFSDIDMEVYIIQAQNCSNVSFFKKKSCSDIWCVHKGIDLFGLSAHYLSMIIFVYLNVDVSTERRLYMFFKTKDNLKLVLIKGTVANMKWIWKAVPASLFLSCFCYSSKIRPGNFFKKYFYNQMPNLQTLYDGQMLSQLPTLFINSSCNSDQIDFIASGQ